VVEVNTHLSFALRRDQVKERILIPKYYDPDIVAAIGLASASNFDVIKLRDLLAPGDAGSKLGVWVPREHYGSGDIPYVRTSDLSEWRIRPDVKKGVSDDVYNAYAARVDVREGDLLMVAHGTYLVGTVAIVEHGEDRLVLQDHVFRLRLRNGISVTPYLLLALLSTAFVLRQIRCRQFSADIIDKIGERHLDVCVAIPKDMKVRETVSRNVGAILKKQTKTRAAMRLSIDSDLRMTRERAIARHAFTVRRRDIVSRILVPKYYDPALEQDLKAAQASSKLPWVTIQELITSDQISVSTGVEVGKMAYGTGRIPFVRTSDIAEWSVKLDVRHGISEDIFAEYGEKASVKDGDIVLVRDGTYLVGSSAIVSADNVPALICGGLYRLRCADQSSITPAKLLGLLNLPIVRRQMRARQFTRDVIDTLGKRLMEIRIPGPMDRFAIDLESKVAEIIKDRKALKMEINSTTSTLEPPGPAQAKGRPGWSMR
jgi:hypothetical protein